MNGRSKKKDELQIPCGIADYGPMARESYCCVDEQEFSRVVLDRLLPIVKGAEPAWMEGR